MAGAGLHWAAVLTPAVLVGVYEMLRHHYVDPTVALPAGNVMASVVVIVATAVLQHRIYRVAESVFRRSEATAAALSERNRIAREVHDGISQGLFLLRVRLSRVLEGVREERGEEVCEPLVDAIRLTEELEREARRLIRGLRDEGEGGPAGDGAGAGEEDLVAALQACARRFCEATGIACGVDLPPEGAAPLDPAQLRHVLRIVQEALSNVHRHAGASRACIRLARGEGGWVLSVEDDGRGLSLGMGRDGVPEGRAGAAGGFGLAIMRERAALLGGELRVESAASRGTRVELWIPFAQERDGVGGRALPRVSGARGR